MYIYICISLYICISVLYICLYCVYISIQERDLESLGAYSTLLQALPWSFYFVPSFSPLFLLCFLFLYQAGLHADVLRRIFTFLALLSRSPSSSSNINTFSSSSSLHGRSTSSPGELNPTPSFSRKREASSHGSPSRKVQMLASMNITQSQCIELLHTMATTGLYSAPAFDALLLRLFPPSGVCTPQGGRGGDSEEMRQYDDINQNPSYLVSSSSSSRSEANGVTGFDQFPHSIRGEREEEFQRSRRKDNSGLVGMRRRLLLDHQSESLRTLKLVELTMRLDLPHTYGQLSPEAMRILGLIRDTPYVGKEIIRWRNGCGFWPLLRAVRNR